MGSIVPIALQALSVAQAVGTVATTAGKGIDVFDSSSRKSSELTIRQLQQKQNAESQRAANKAELDRQKIRTDAAEGESKRRLALKRAVARQRAKFGSRGVSSIGGSSEAVLLGLFEESDEQRSIRERLDNIRLKSIDQNLNNVRRVNTLERTQLREKEKLKNSRSSLKTATELFSIF